MDLARLAWMSRRRRRRHERRQKHGRALGALRSALVGLVSIFLLCVVSFFALFGSRRSTARISPWTSGPSTCRKLQKTYSSSNSTPQAWTSSCRSRRTAAPPGSPSRQGRRRVRPRKPQPPKVVLRATRAVAAVRTTPTITAALEPAATTAIGLQAAPDLRPTSPLR